jgi:hypothetical protein
MGALLMHLVRACHTCVKCPTVPLHGCAAGNYEGRVRNIASWQSWGYSQISVTVASWQSCGYSHISSTETKDWYGIHQQTELCC